MPNSFTTSFASAAAGATSDTMSRREGSGSEWSRTRVNGTQTFRRPSTQSRDNLNASSNSSAAPYVPPHMSQQASSTRNGLSSDLRYSRDDLLGVYKLQHESGLLGSDLDRYFAGPWDFSNGSSSRPDSKDVSVEVCWHSEPHTVPLGLQEMDESEKQLFSSSVNSPLKMNNPKDGPPTASGARKISLSMVNTSGVPRPGTRRRETSDSFAGNGPLSPTDVKPSRNEPTTSTPPAALLRRRTDHIEEPQEKEEARVLPENSSPFGTLRRAGTTGPLSAGLNPSSASPWSAGPQSAFGSMGAFASLSTDNASSADPPSQRPGFGSARSTSRFKDILGKPNEEPSQLVKEKASFTGLEKLPEEEDSAQSKFRDQVKNRPYRSETNPYDDLVPGRSGSAALSAQDDPGVMEQMGFNPYPTARDLQSAQTPHHRFTHDPTSPTSTNPYQSPQGGRVPEDDGQEDQSGMQPYGRRDVFSGADHRGQNSFGSLRGMGGGMGGFGGLGGWTNPGFGTGTPARERPAVSSTFGDPVFSPLGDLQSPGGFGGNNFFGGSNAPFGGAARQSKLGLPFPPAMQEQMRSDSRNDAFSGRADPFEPPRPDSFRGAFEETKRPGEDSFGAPPANRSPVGPSGRPGSEGPREGSGSNSPSQIPTAQQRQMVMPDRMRWVYRDPHGNVQGPWSGLEMHDWFKAGFFTAELQVKKLEDAEYEPLAQLVRRIGNSREPFLVPQIGVPHGPPPSNGPNPWSAGGPPTSAQPPFASAFPSFGTTLTAEQQNALERRKQEEQFLMARQKEFLAQRQVQMHSQNGPHGSYMPSLQHHSSAHSLHSQPSFGSMTSPSGYQQSPMQAPIGQQPPHHISAFQSMTPTSSLPPASREDDLPSQFNRMSMETRGPYSGGNQQSFAAHERSRLSMENQQAQQYTHESTFLGQQGRNERLEEFHELRRDLDEDKLDEEAFPAPIGSQRPTEDAVTTLKQIPAPIGAPSKKTVEDNESLSLTQQVQRTAAANKQAAEETYAIEPPPVSNSPLPAPAAQRSRPTVAENLVVESRSPVQTPVETPGVSVAPWADKSSEVQKGPSLKEIQEAEAKRAAEQEAILAEARRVQMEQERVAAAQMIPPAPGLPLTSTWASSGSPGTPTTPGGSVWAKPVTTKANPETRPKKTLAQIQKEEEARKQRAAAQATANAQSAQYNNPTLPVGNRYAQMASKATAPLQTSPTPTQALNQPVATGAWTTVGASGKPKTPATVVATPTVQRTVSSSTVVAARPATGPSRSASLAGGTKSQAKEELTKWAKTSLSKGLSSNINVDEFVKTLFDLPAEIEILAEAVYGSSETLDGRRFAEEFIRRRKLAEKGIVEADNNKTTLSSETKPANGGWSEVAKKGPIGQPKDDSATTTGFKVVSKKKGKR